MLELQRVLSLIYPDQCLLCPTIVNSDGGLCASCWRDVPFLQGHGCDTCGASLLGRGDGIRDFCDDCLLSPRPWASGRSVFSYRGNGRKIVLALKHGDRPEMARHLSRWMLQAGRDVVDRSTVCVPIPIHWSRLLKRKYNQSAELARALARHANMHYLPDALVRIRRTASQDGLSVDERFANIAGSIKPHPRFGSALKDRDICLIDDVMTSGSTLSCATDACLGAGAASVSVLVLARVSKDT